jgi:oleate hydratase
VYNQYDAIVRPLTVWLEKQGVRFVRDTRVTDMQFAESGGKLAVKSLELEAIGKNGTVSVDDGDLVFFQNGSMTDASSLGSMTAPPPRLTKSASKGWELWEKIALGRPEFGNPAAFNSSIPESY